MKIFIFNRWSVIKPLPDAAYAAVYDELKYVTNEYKGKYSSMLTKKGAFLTGLLSKVVARLKKEGFQYNLVDNRNNECISDPVYTLSSGELRDRQKDVIDAVNAQVLWGRGIIDAATNFGKNWIICSLVKQLCFSRVLILVHRKELFNQLFSFFTENGIDVKAFDSRKQYGDVTLAMSKTLYNCLDDEEVRRHLESVTAVIVDECHRAASDTYKKIFENLVNAKYNYGLSGTPFTGDLYHDYTVLGLFGEPIVTVSNQDLINDKVSLLPEVHFYHLASRWNLLLDYEDEKMEIIRNDYRIRVMRSYIDFYKDKAILIAVQSKEHGEYLWSSFMDLNTTVAFIYGDDPDRELKLQAFKDGSIHTLITTEILKEGVNIPRINILINASWGKSVVWVKQFVGRLLRHDGVSERCTIVDFMDTGKNTREHSIARYNIYKEEGFTISDLYEEKER